jgi:hypothetical protein
MSHKTVKHILVWVLLSGSAVLSCSPQTSDIGTRLAEWRKGVWVSGSGTYTIYTADHYFVLSYEGDSPAANLYFGVSQLTFCNQGQARKQLIRLRQMPGSEPAAFKNPAFGDNHAEQPLIIDTTLFTPGVCNIDKGIIYDSITEVTDEYILLATCNGDREKIFNNGVAVYLPAAGGEFYSYRVEQL